MFYTGNLLYDSKITALHMRYFNPTSFKYIFEKMRKLGYKIQTKKWYVPMSCFGSTFGTTNYPNMFINNKFQNIPRPYSTYRPNTEGYLFIHKKWFSQFIQHIEAKVIQYLMLHIIGKDTKTNTLNDIIFSKTYIPKDCRICNSFFTHMIVVGDIAQYGSHVNPHFDSGDTIAALFHVVDNTAKGRSINFNDGLDRKNKEEIYTSIPYEHGRITIGFSNNVIHGTST